MLTDTEVPIDMELAESVAYAFIQDLQTARKISKPDAEYLREKYKYLYNITQKLRNIEKDYEKKCRAVNKEIHEGQMTVEKLRGNEAELLNELRSLERNKDANLKDLFATEQNETRTSFEVSELKKQHDEICVLISNQKKSNQDLVEPVFESLNKEAEKINEEIEKCDVNNEAAEKQKRSLLRKLRDLENLKKSRDEALEQSTESLETAQLDPGRLSRTTASMEKAMNHMKGDLDKLRKGIAAIEEEIQKQVRRKEEAQKLQSSLEDKADLNLQTMEKREEELGIIRMGLENEKYKQHDLITVKVELNLRGKDVDSDLRHKKDQLKLGMKEYDSLKRFYKKKRISADGDHRLLTLCEAQLQEEETRVQDLRGQCDEKKLKIVSIKDELEALTTRLLDQQDVEHVTKEELEQLQAEVEEMDSELLVLMAEDKRTAKLVHMLSGHRDMKAREGTRIVQKEKETKQHVLVKELMVLDLTKRCNEIANRLKEFSALYEVVKNERNKYINLIQSSAQALAEMREKIRILSSEVMILRNETGAKDSALTKERSAHTQAQCHRDALRQEMNKLLAEYRKKQSIVEQQIQEISKLNGVISSLEQEMIVLKARNERCIDERNAIGVQLIDRNDELCILYERSKQQQDILEKGEAELKKKEDDLRILRLQAEDLQRHYRAAVSHVPEASHLRQKLQRLEEELASERKMNDDLGAQMEDPSNTARWRQVEGSDADEEALSLRIKHYEGLLNKRRDQLLEKSLVLEEVVNLTDKLRAQALKRRDAARSMADQLHVLQTRVREVTKKMLASVSELSMYQATALRLQEEKVRREKELGEAKWRADHGEAPNDDAVKELERLERRKAMQTAAALTRRDELPIDKPDQIVKSTAMPRPTAYIPDDLGIPKPYGNSAPFKPSENTSSMRHIRPPQPKAIEI